MTSLAHNFAIVYVCKKKWEYRYTNLSHIVVCYYMELRTAITSYSRYQIFTNGRLVSCLDIIEHK